MGRKGSGLPGNDRCLLHLADIVYYKRNFSSFIYQQCVIHCASKNNICFIGLEGFTKLTGILNAFIMALKIGM